MEMLSFENDVISFELKEGILYGRYKVMQIDLETAMFATSFRHQITAGRKFPSIADLSMVKRVTKDARSFFSSDQAGEDLLALALVVNNPVTRTMVNFFLKFHQPPYPFRLFSNLEEAAIWINKKI